MRNIIEVIDQIKAVVPSTELGCHHGLDKVRHRATYSAPETAGALWGELAIVLASNLGDPNDGPESDREWKKKVQAIIKG